MLLEWSEKYSVKNHLIDSQHKKLVDMINELHSAMKVAKGKEILQVILDELVWYTKEHSRTEEQMMMRINHSGLAQLKREHEDMTKKVIQLRKEFKSGKSILTFEVMDLLKNWLINHIDGSNNKIYRFSI